MYKGKFNQKGKTTDIEQLLAERAAANAKETKKPAPKADDWDADLLTPKSQAKTQAPKAQSVNPGARPTAPKAPASGTAQPKAPRTGKPVPPAAPTAQGRKAPAPVPQKKKKGPRTGGVIFYTLYFMFILVFFICTYFGMNWLYGWLEDFEASQPTAKAEQVFNQLFTNPDWSALYEASGAQDSPYIWKPPPVCPAIRSTRSAWAMKPSPPSPWWTRTMWATPLWKTWATSPTGSWAAWN